MSSSQKMDQQIIPIEEDETICGKGRVDGTTPEKTIPIEEEMIRGRSELKEKLKSFKDAVSEEQQKNMKSQVPVPKIQRVSCVLRQGNEKFEKYYMPKMVSIGPLHHGSDKLKQAEKLKFKLATLFVTELGLEYEKNLLNDIMNNINRFKKRYDDEDDIKDFKDEDLGWMFFVDGCALLHYIHCDSQGKLNDLKLNAFPQQDLFLLENQLPYEVLDELMRSTADNGKKLKESIHKFIDKTARHIRGSSSIAATSTDESSSSQPQDALPSHLLELLWRRLGGSQGEENRNKQQKTGQRQKNYSFRNVNELVAAGIQLNCETNGSLKSIEFTPYWFTGILKLPSLLVDDSTAPTFKNLIAFEMCPDFHNDFQVTPFFSFLDSLIDQPDDVKLLRKAYILTNKMGSDEEVAQLFNEIGVHDIVSKPELYSAVKDKIQCHYDNKWKNWIAQAFHDYLSSPWAFIALSVGALEAWYTIKER